MGLLNDGRLKGDRISSLAGYDGSESKAVLSWSRQYKNSFPVRIVFAINQHYPELPSGFYCNKRLVALSQHALENIRLYVVIEDNLNPDNVVPVELAGSLEIGDDYLLVESSLKICGRLNVWEASGGKSPFYHDNFIVEIISDEVHCKGMLQAVEMASKLNHLEFDINKSSKQ